MTVRAGGRRHYLGATDPWALGCAYQAGHAYAQAGKPDKALPQLLATSGDLEGALAELRAVRPVLAAAYGAESAQVRNLDKQAARLRSG